MSHHREQVLWQCAMVGVHNAKQGKYGEGQGAMRSDKEQANPQIASSPDTGEA
jgi:hypothetical protein